MTDADVLFETAEAFVEGLSAGDLGAATRAAVRLERSRVDTAATTTAFGRAIEAGNDGAARALLSELRRQYDRVAGGERRQVERSLLARRQADATTSGKQTLASHVQAYSEVSIRRAGVLSTGAGFLGDPDPPSGRRSELVETVSRAADVENTFDGRQASARTLTRSMSLPARPTVLSIDVTPARLVVDEPGTLVVTVGNVGDDPAGNVRIRTSGNVEVAPSSRVLGTLGPREESSIRLSVTASEATGRTVSVEVTSDAGGDTDRETLTVTEHEPILRALDTDGDGLLDTDEVQTALGYWDADESVPGTGGATLTEAEVLRLLQLWAHDVPVRDA